MAPVISAVVFDMYGTLTPSRPKAYWDEQKAACAGPLGVPVDAWVAALDGTWHERVTGQFGSLAETFRAVAALAGLEPTPEQLAASVAARLADYRKVQDFRPDAVETLTALRADGLKIALVSDCTAELPELWDDFDVAPLFDATVFSCAEGVRKPDPRLFRAAAQRLGVAPENCLYVGDGGGDELAGSAAVGMHPVLLAGDDWAEHHAADRPREWPGRRVAALGEIPAVLAEFAL